MTMIFVSAFLLLALIGALDTVYLISKRRASQAPICPLRGDCKAVLNSKYNITFGIHNDIVGLLYYVGIFFSPVPLTLFFFLPDSVAGPYVFGAILLITTLGIYLSTLLAFLMTLRLLYIQFFVIKKMCFWCLLSSLCVIGMTIILAIPLFSL